MGLRGKVILTAIVVGAIALMAAWWMVRWPRGEIVQVAPLDPEHAIFAYFDGDADGEFHEDESGLVMRDRAGDVLWTAEMQRAHVHIHLNVLKEHGVVVASTYEDDEALFEAFSLDDGSRLWTWLNQIPDPRESVVEAPLYLPRVRLEGSLVVFPSRKLAVALDPDSGRELARVQLPSRPQWFVMQGERMLIQLDPSTETELFRPGDPYAELGSSGSGLNMRNWPTVTCWLPDSVIVANEDEERSFSLVPLADRENDRPIIGLAGLYFIAPLCALRQDRVLLLEGVDTDGVDTASLIELDARTLERKRLLSLTGMRLTHDRGSHPFGNSLPRFVPSLFDERAMAHRLVVLDIDEMRVAWQSEAREELLHFEMFQAEGHAYLVRSGGYLARFDGDTGQIAAATHLWYGEVQPHQVRDGTIWLTHAGDYAVLDAMTFDVLFSTTEEHPFDDARLELTEWLGESSNLEQ